MIDHIKGQNQHHVPVFLQKGWLPDPCGSEGQVPYATLIPQYGKVLNGNKGPKTLNYSVDQWTIISNGQRSSMIEDGFTRFDTRAATIIQNLRSRRGISFISATDKAAIWDFIKSLIVREPEEIEALKEDVKHQVVSVFRRSPELRKIMESSPQSEEEFISALVRRDLKNLGVSFIPEVFNSKLWNERAKGLELLCINYRPRDVNFLLSDRPVITFDFPKEKQRAYMLPISRNSILILSSNIEFAKVIQKTNPKSFSKIVNKLEVSRASKLIVGDVRKHLPLLKKKCSGSLASDPLLKRTNDSIASQISVRLKFRIAEETV